MTREEKKLLQKFQCEQNRTFEESFARMFSERNDVRLFFVNENQAFTDGRNIVVDPAWDELFCDVNALSNTEKALRIPHCYSENPWLALHMITRGQTLHECLHILYTDFPCACINDPICDTRAKKKAMAYISNIIEDAYIEAAGCSAYDNLELYLQFERIVHLYAAVKSAGTIEKAYAQEYQTETGRSKTALFMAYMNHMITLLLYPMIALEAPADDIAGYTEQTRQLFLDGSVAASPAERYKFCQKIFQIILPIIPDEEDAIPERWMERLLGGCKTHSTDEMVIGQKARKGKAQNVTVRLFTDQNGALRAGIDLRDMLSGVLREFQTQAKAIELIYADSSRSVYYSGSQLKGNAVHDQIQIHEYKPGVNWKNREAYQAVRNHYHSVLRMYQTRFTQLLRAKAEVREDRHRFGSGINTKRFGDVQKRYWYRTVPGEKIPEFSVLLLIDGSGSMYGNRIHSAMQAAVILHEILDAQGIEHAAAEHRSHFEEPEMDINILYDFGARDKEKYNLTDMKAYGDNRDALALLWAEQYMKRHTQTEERLLIVISDGEPAHDYDEYYPPFSVADTAETVRLIRRRGTHVIGVALDDHDSLECYEALKQIYPQLVSCNDLSRLPKQVLGIVSRFFGR